MTAVVRFEWCMGILYEHVCGWKGPDNARLEESALCLAPRVWIIYGSKRLNGAQNE